MTLNIPISTWRYRWLALLGCTLGIQLVIMVVMGVIGTRLIWFSDWEVLWLIGLFCLPAVWSAISIWRFRSIAERRVGYFAAVVSLYWLWAAVEVLLG
jgi:hypothetical protein